MDPPPSQLHELRPLELGGGDVLGYGMVDNPVLVLVLYVRTCVRAFAFADKTAESGRSRAWIMEAMETFQMEKKERKKEEEEEEEKKGGVRYGYVDMWSQGNKRGGGAPPCYDYYLLLLLLHTVIIVRVVAR
jgi:hypothetical protein